jgi:hypothetical protein
MTASTKILLIGGDDPALDAIGRALEEAGAAARRATCALALQAVLSDRPDAVLLFDEDDAVLGELTTKAARIPVIVMRSSDEAPRGIEQRAIATISRGEPKDVAARTLTLARELKPQPIRIRASVTTARFGAVPPRDARRVSRLRMQFRTLAAGASLADVPRELEKRTSIPTRRRAAARVMRVPANRHELEPSTSIQATQTDLRAVPAPRPRLPIAAIALVVALLVVVVASVVRAMH